MGTEHDDSVGDGAVAFIFLAFWVITIGFMIYDHWQWFISHPLFFLVPAIVLAPFVVPIVWKCVTWLFPRLLNLMLPQSEA